MKTVLGILNMYGLRWNMLLFLWCFAIHGCGYHLQGATAPGERTLEIHIFENRTVETGIESILTDRILEELRRMPGWKMVPPGEGRYELTGVLRDFTTEVISVSEKQLADRQRATIFIEVSLRDRVTGEKLWRTPLMNNFANYRISDDVLQNERNKLGAVSEIADKLATRIRNRIYDIW
jgi:hypothetical protein